MKQLLAGILALTMLTAVAFANPVPTTSAEARDSAPQAMQPADESGGSDARLAAVTLKVKNLLNLNTDEYEEFSGNLSENALAPTWNLSWSGISGSLNITASEDGRILGLYRYEYDYYRDPFDSAFGPRYPKDESAAAKVAAEAFAAKVFTGVETVKLDDSSYNTYPMRPVSSYYGDGTYSFNSTIYLNGLPSPMGTHITVRGSDGQIMNFSRDPYDDRYLGEVPSATVVTTEADARALLRGTLDLRLEYVDDPSSGDHAILRYLPVTDDEYYVDAVTGKLVNLSELFRGVTEIYDSEKRLAYLSEAPRTESSMDMAGGATLNQMEQEGVAQLEGVLPKEALAAAVQTAYPEFGLSSYTLANASYAVDKDGEDTRVSCTLTFSKKQGDGILRRMVTVDGKTAALDSVYTYYPWQENYNGPAVKFAEAEKTAEAFLTAHFGSDFAKTERSHTNDAATKSYGMRAHSFGYTRVEHGYRYGGNSLSIGIDPQDGSVSDFSRNWNEALTFESPEGIVDREAALDAYLNAYLANVSYIGVPKALDGASPEYQTLMEQGYGYFFTLVTGYQLSLEPNTWFVGVDARDGKAVIDLHSRDIQPLEYDDLNGSWAKAAIERLAATGVGYDGGKFQPAKQLTQLDLVALLVSTSGSAADLSAEHAADNIYNNAYNMGLLKKSARDDNKVLTRLEMVKLILDASGYGRVAQLDGIFTCPFTDAAQIPAELYGYAAVAHGLGILRGNSAGQCMPSATATRAEAAAMLDQFMSR